VFVTPRLSPELIADIYARFWRSYKPQALPQDPFAYHLCRHLAKFSEFGKLLDFGCGWGQYLGAAKAVGWDAIGIEIDPEKIEFARSQGLNAVQGELLDGIFDSETFDAVIAQQVFEHLYDPVSYIEEIRRVLKPGGVLFVSVPNYGSVLARFAGANWDMVSPVAHVRYFTSGTLKQLLSDHGFEVLSKRYVRRFENNLLKDMAYQASVVFENVFQIYPRTALSLYACKA
jgi:SAM-dependent methyltransferase